MHQCQLSQNCRWSHEENIILIKLWRSDDIHQKLNGTAPDCLVYSEIADVLRTNGFQKTVQQVKLKIKNLKREYKSALNKLRASGGRAKLTFRYFNELDKFLRRDPPTVSTPTVIYMEQEIMSAKNTDEESMAASSPSGNTKRLAFESQFDDNSVPSTEKANAQTSSDEESIDCPLANPIVTKFDDTTNSDHALYTSKADGKDEDEDIDLSSLGTLNDGGHDKNIKKAKENKTRLNTMEEIMSRVLDTALYKFMQFERQIEEKNREETNSFRNEVLALERKKLEESVTQTLQNERLICLMESLVPNPR